MRILFIADGRSQIAANWIEYFTRREHEVHLVSTFDCVPKLQLTSLQVVPVAFSGLKRFAPQHRQFNQMVLPQPEQALEIKGSTLRKGMWGARMVGLRTSLRQWLGPLTLARAARKLAEIFRELQPDLVHAMRIPYEGMLAALTKERLSQPCPPLLISVWGNDFTLHAPSTPWMAALTRAALTSADAVHTDCQRDLRLAHTWGFDPALPAVVLPGAGGIQTDLFYPPVEESSRQAPLVINPRGFRAYVRNDVFFKALPRVLAQCPQARFVCPTMAGEAQPRRWIAQYGLGEAVDLLPKVDRAQMADLFRSAQVAVSPSIHDGTPNTLLEAMACGCFPIAGDLESLREWIIPGENGLLVDPSDPQSLAEAILQALGDARLRQQAAAFNRALVLEKAEYGKVMQQAEAFYTRLTA